MDLGAGDGRFVLAHAAAHPERFTLGIDADARTLSDAARRAAARHARGGVANARFVVSAVEVLPSSLDGFADLVTVHFPWGSLRDAVVAANGPGADRIAGLVRPGGRLAILVADAPSDGVRALDPDGMVRAWTARGLDLVELRPAGLADAVAVRSSWGKRLLRNPAPGRSAWWVTLDRPSAGPDGGD